MLMNLLTHPMARGLSPDDPNTTVVRRKIIKEKGVLSKLYGEWYRRLLEKIPEERCLGPMLEIGSGGGFLKEFRSDCITSEVFHLPEIDFVLNAEELPFKSNSLGSILMVDVFHHIPDVYLFLTEAQRVLAPGGRIVMLEPWNTAWGRWVYKNLHPEPFLPESERWALPSTENRDGPLSRANGALPWIVFCRDRFKFTREFPFLQVEGIELDYPFTYLLSGGVSMRSLCPGWSYAPLRFLEKILTPAMNSLAMFALISISVCKSKEA